MATKGTVIIADGDRTVLELLQIRLQVAGYAANPARNGAAVLEQLAEGRPAALVIDAKLANADGSLVLDILLKTVGSFGCPTLVIGRNLSEEDLARAVKMGANDCMAKPFSGAEILERVGRILRDPEEYARLHVVQARCLDPQALQKLYPHEAAEHRRILFERGSGLCPTWKAFRQFLIDLGPSPSPDHIATRLAAGDLTYISGKVAWIHRDRQPSLNERWSQISSEGRDADGRYATVRGRQIGYAALSAHIRVPVDAIAVALRGQSCADELVQQASIAEVLTQDGAHWMPEDRREAFLTGYRMWHLQVQPRFAAAATPAFLFVFSALPTMLKFRDELVELGLWNPSTEAGKQARSAHPVWSRFEGTRLRVEAARVQLAVYRQYCLSSELDSLWARVKSAEQRFRAAAPKAAKLAA